MNTLRFRSPYSFFALLVRLSDVQWQRPQQCDLTWLDLSYITTEQGTDLMQERFSHRLFQNLFIFGAVFVSSADRLCHPGVWDFDLI